jgi:hypothetical protein
MPKGAFGLIAASAMKPFALFGSGVKKKNSQKKISSFPFLFPFLVLFFYQVFSLV